jgi:hypothetical protein
VVLRYTSPLPLAAAADLLPAHNPHLGSTPVQCNDMLQLQPLGTYVIVSIAIELMDVTQISRARRRASSAATNFRERKPTTPSHRAVNRSISKNNNKTTKKQQKTTDLVYQMLKHLWLSPRST